ncbi:MAG: hypothetical protein GY820_20970 [Gammaproteobacteria bacterium]|nr:hypothetical protein [Gammaproteobacteria bacterium]
MREKGGGVFRVVLQSRAATTKQCRSVPRMLCASSLVAAILVNKHGGHPLGYLQNVFKMCLI